MDVKQIGTYIALQRKKQNLTQMQLAEALGVSNRAVSKWETGKCLPDAALWVPLSEYLEISIEELYFGGSPMGEKKKVVMEGQKMSEKNTGNEKENINRHLIEEALLQNVNFHEAIKKSRNLMIGLSLIVFGFITDISTQIRQLEIQLHPDKFDSMDKFFIGFKNGISIGIIILGIALITKDLVHFHPKMTDGRKS